MTNLFIDSSSYYNALLKQSNFEQNSFLRSLKGNLKAKIPEVSYPNYCKAYQPKNIAARKIFAIPAALFAGLIKVIYHLGCAIFGGLRHAFCHKGMSFKATMFTIGRDFEEAAGYFVALVNDRRGTYLIQKSAFYKTCYSLMYCDEKLKLPPATQQPPQRVADSGVHPQKKSSRESNLRNLRKELRPIPRGILKPYISSVTGPIEPLKIEVVPFEKYATEKSANKGKTPEAIEEPPTPLPQVSAFASMPVEELNALTIGQVLDINSEDAKEISSRLLKGVRDDSKLQIANQDKALQLSIVQFRLLNAEELKSALLFFPEQAQLLLQPDQLLQFHEAVSANAANIGLIKFREMSTDEQKLHIKMYGLQKILLHIGEKRFFEWLAKTDSSELSSYTLADLLENKYWKSQLNNELMTAKELLALTIKQFVSMPEAIRKKLTGIELTQLNADDMPAINLPDAPDKDDALNLSLQQLRFLNSPHLKKIIHWLDPYVCAFLSDPQIKRLDIPSISPEQIQKIFLDGNKKENRTRASLLTDWQQIEVLGKLDESQKVRFLELRSDATQRQSQFMQRASLTTRPPVKKKVTFGLDDVAEE